MCTVEIKDGIMTKLSSLRSIARIISSSKFETACQVATEADLVLLKKYINYFDKDSISSWVRHKLHDKNIFELRNQAKNLGIKDYNKIHKYLLSNIISERQKEVV